MILLSNLMMGIARVLEVILNLTSLLIILRVIVSWFQINPYNPYVKALYNATEFFLAPIRKKLPRSQSIDWSIIIVFIVVIFLNAFLVQSLLDYAISIKQGVLFRGGRL